MTLSNDAVIEIVKRILPIREAELEVFDNLHAYLHGKQSQPFLGSGVPNDVKRLIEMSRVNVLKLVVSAVAQALYVDGYRKKREADDAPAWDIWQSNKMDAKQIPVHRAALTYGVSYVTVLPGDPAPVITGYSPRRMTTLYGDDPDWPMFALQADPGGSMFRLYDQTDIYFVTVSKAEDSSEVRVTLLESRPHEAPGIVPVVRFLNVDDLDEDFEGEIEGLIPIQDQIDTTTFHLKVAEVYAAFRQRWIIGWTADDENEKLKATASRMWAFEDADVKVGDFEQTELDGYIASREASMRHAAALSQTPAHELIGQLVNLSAEALVAAEAASRRKVTERQKSFGESWEQVLELAGTLANPETVDSSAQVRWADTESRALAATADALGKLATQLGIPVQELWERIPGVTQQDIDRWKATLESSDPLANLGTLLERQATRTLPAA